MSTSLAEVHDKNYAFGEALLKLEHSSAKKYHKLSQRGKTRFRETQERKALSPSPYMAKYREVHKAYLLFYKARAEARTIDEITRKLEVQ